MSNYTSEIPAEQDAEAELWAEMARREAEDYIAIHGEGVSLESDLKAKVDPSRGITPEPTVKRGPGRPRKS